MCTSVTEATVRRQTAAAGAAYVAVQEQEVARLERDAPPAPQGPEKQFLSVDGAFVPLVGGEWAEVKTLVIGEVEPPKQVKGETVIQTRALSYFSRLTDATTFQRLALVETHRRGVETAGAVGAVTDGSEWCQGFVDFHRSDAVRILDFPHAGGHVAQIGQAVFGEGTSATEAWFTQQLHQLKHDGPTTVLAEVHDLLEAHADLTALSEPVAYLDKREAHRHASRRRFRRRVGPLAMARWKVGTNSSWKRASKAVACIGPGPTSIRCWPCATWPAMTVGMKAGPRLSVNCAGRHGTAAPNVVSNDAPAVKRTAC